MMTVNLEYLKVFYYTANCGSVTKAAALLSISQPAVSQSVKLLESQLGVSLFQRESRGVTLTAEGRVLYEYVKAGYEQFLLGTEEVQKMKNLETGEVHIGASDMTLQFYLLPFLESYSEQYPAIKVNVTNGPTPETLQSLREGIIDFGVVSSPFEAADDMEVIPVREVENVFVAGRRFIAYKNRMLDLQELLKLPMIVLENNTSSRSYMNRYLAENGITLAPEFELATSDMIVQFALRNLGVGCVVRDFAKEALDSGVLFELRFNRMIPKRHFCVVKRKHAVLSNAAARLLETMGLIERG